MPGHGSVRSPERRRLRVCGVVQGVGFRPFVHRLATELGLAGFVGNDDEGVFVEVEGSPPRLDEFGERLRVELPRLASISSVDVVSVPVLGGAGFVIVASQHRDGARAALPPDVAPCRACLAEIRDPEARRYRHPFANCTDCGPRLSVIRDLPYDRPATTMAAFEMCPACAAEYHDPSDRRHHAQPIACPSCGPTLTFEQAGRTVRGTDAALLATHRALAAGAVVAVKGVGGYHLVCDAASESAVALLRTRKQRPSKPLAVMVPSVAVAAELAHVRSDEAAALESPAAPVVLLARREGAAVAPSVAPGNPLLGIMLPPSPLHHLLLAPVPGAEVVPPRVVVLTSGNLSDEPIAFDDVDAQRRLGALVDAWLVHDRPIHVPVDDSVVRLVDGDVHPVRRSRGYAPVPVSLAFDVPPTLAVGGEIKNTFCLADGRRAWVSQHIGDMGNLETLHAFERVVAGFERMYGVVPEVVAVDRHPGYLTRRWGLQRVRAEGLEAVEVQHHHAHLAALMAEHGLDERGEVLGLAFDGTGHGLAGDGSVELWGGEVLRAGFRSFDRVGHLRPLPLPGGDEGVRNPCRAAVAQLLSLGIDAEGLPCHRTCSPLERVVLARQAQTGVGCVPTTSMGRLFDVVAAIVGVRQRIDFEAQAAIDLEAAAASFEGEAPALELVLGPDGVIDPEPLLRELAALVRRGMGAPALAAAFHTAVAEVVQRVVDRHAGSALPVGLTGGVFQNALLTGEVVRRLRGDGHTVLTHRTVPANDGGLALGQAVIAGVARQRRQ